MPLVMDAGETSATAAFAGSMKSVSSRAITASARALRTRASADGFEKRISSSVRTAIDATLEKPKVMVAKSNLVRGLALP